MALLFHAIVPGVVEDPIAKAWSRVEAAWEDDEEHRRFVALCVALERLPEAGQRYRQVCDTNSARKDEAHRRIDALIAVATEKLRETAADKFHLRDSKRTLVVFTFIVMGTLMAVAIWLMLRGHS